MSGQEVINKAYREVESLLQAPAATFAAERNRRFRRLLEHHVHNARNTAYTELWRSHGLDPHDVPTDLAEVERLPLVDRQFLYDCTRRKRYGQGFSLPNNGWKPRSDVYPPR